jgi:hypothetical protein
MSDTAAEDSLGRYCHRDSAAQCDRPVMPVHRMLDTSAPLVAPSIAIEPRCGRIRAALPMVVSPALGWAAEGDVVLVDDSGFDRPLAPPN